MTPGVQRIWHLPATRKTDHWPAARVVLALACVLLGPCALEAVAEVPLPVERVHLDTPDGVRLVADYYPVRSGGDSPVVVLLADEGESRLVFRRLASRLQSPSEGKPFAVLAVDLRGQGDSIRRRLPGGGTRDLSGEKITREVVGAMVRIDLEAVRGFLVERNDARELNLNRLAYLGVGMGAVVAVNGAAVDWSTPILNTGKQGEDVKALVLISSPWKYKGVGVLDALRQPGVANEVAFLLLYGKEDRTTSSSASRIVKQLERARGEQPEPSDDYLPTIVDAAGRSGLTGMAWLKQAGVNAEKLIVRHLQQHVAEPEYRWAKRRLD